MLFFLAHLPLAEPLRGLKMSDNAIMQGSTGDGRNVRIQPNTTQHNTAMRGLERKVGNEGNTYLP